MNVLFIDFDGVLRTPRSVIGAYTARGESKVEDPTDLLDLYAQTMDPVAVGIFNRALKETNSQYVVTSMVRSIVQHDFAATFVARCGLAPARFLAMLPPGNDKASLINAHYASVRGLVIDDVHIDCCHPSILVPDNIGLSVSEYNWIIRKMNGAHDEATTQPRKSRIEDGE